MLDLFGAAWAWSEGHRWVVWAVAAGSLGVEPLPDIPTEVSAKRAAEPESDDDEVAASSEEADDPED